jgi:hypothetical protein
MGQIVSTRRKHEISSNSFVDRPQSREGSCNNAQTPPPQGNCFICFILFIAGTTGSFRVLANEYDPRSPSMNVERTPIEVDKCDATSKCGAET